MGADVSMWAFAIASLALLLVPGPAVAFVVARSLEGGRRAGILSQLGLCSGLLVHALAAVVGLSALIARSAVAFSALKLAGALYLAWLGWRTLASDPESSVGTARARSPRARRRLFLDGFWIDVLNPKPALFFLALLPQFAGPSSAGAPARMALLGLVFVALAFATGSGYAVLAGALAPHLRTSARLRRVTRWSSGATYLGLAALAALWRR